MTARGVAVPDWGWSVLPAAVGGLVMGLISGTRFDVVSRWLDGRSRRRGEVACAVRVVNGSHAGLGRRWSFGGARLRPGGLELRPSTIGRVRRPLGRHDPVEVVMSSPELTRRTPGFWEGLNLPQTSPSVVVLTIATGVVEVLVEATHRFDVTDRLRGWPPTG